LAGAQFESCGVRSFHSSAQEVNVEDGHVLIAQLCNEDGDFVDAQFDLNDCIGNNNGSFHWGGGGFADSAEDISFEMEGDGEPILRARLYNMDGELVECDINLAERLGNANGEFTFDNHDE
jgi:hypothetical protein